MQKAKEAICRNCMRAMYQLPRMKVWFHEASNYARCYPENKQDMRVAEPYQPGEQNA